MGPIDIPSELEFLSFFGVEPSVEESMVCYSIQDKSKVQLKFYLDEVSNNLGITLTYRDFTIRNSYEELTRIQFIKKHNHEVLSAECTYSGCTIKVELSIYPNINLSCESISI